MPSDSSRPRSVKLKGILTDRVPDEVIMPTSWRRALMAIFLTVLLVMAINLLARWYLDNYPTNRGYWLEREKWKLLGSLSEPVDWLILGDSSANQSVIPTVVEERLGGNGINLATTAGTTLVDDVWMLEEYIDRHGAPENVLVIHTVDVWSRGLEKVMIAKIPRPWGFWRSSALDPGLSLDQWTDVFLARYVPLFGESNSIMVAILRGMASPNELFLEHFHLEPGGYMKSTRANTRLADKESSEMVDRFEKQGFRMSTINQAALDSMVSLAEEHDFNLFLANGPLYEAIIHDERAQAYFYDLNQSIAAIAAVSDNVHYLSLMAGFPLENMENADHVVHIAAEIFSQMLATEIAANQAGAADQP